MSRHVTKDELNAALEAWCTARETTATEQAAWGTILHNHDSLINSLRENGHSWADAEEEFSRISKGHAETLMKHWKNMDRLCSEYREIRKRFLSQQK